jgi:hypothetical protein
MASPTDALVKQLLAGRYIASLATKNPDDSIPRGCGGVLVRRLTSLCGEVLAQPQSAECAVRAQGFLDDRRSRPCRNLRYHDRWDRADLNRRLVAAEERRDSSKHLNAASLARSWRTQQTEGYLLSPEVCRPSCQIRG